MYNLKLTFRATTDSKNNKQKTKRDFLFSFQITHIQIYYIKLQM